MKKIMLINVLLVFLSLTGYAEENAPELESFFPSKVEKIVSGEKEAKENIGSVFVYNEESLYTVYCRVNFVTMIMLEPGETATYVTAGDTARWSYDKTVTGSSDGTRQVVYIKPTAVGLTTNIVINTDKRIYNLKIISHKELYNPIIKWRYPNSELMNKMLKEEKEEKMTLTDPSMLNYDYTISTKKYDFSPVSVFDDGKKTYILMKETLQEQPSFYVKEGKELLLVNYRVKGKYIIVDRVFDEGALQLEKKRVVIKKKK